MPNVISKELVKMEKRSMNTLQKIRKLSGKVSKEVREEYKEVRTDGRKLIKQIDARLDKAEDKTKESLIMLRKRFKKMVTELTDAWSKAGEEPVIEYYE